MVRHGTAWYGEVWNGKAGTGTVWQVRRGQVGRVEARPGVDRQVRNGEVWS